MATKSITIKLSPHSCRAAVRELNKLDAKYKRKMDELCLRLAEYGLKRAEIYFSKALYDGVPDVYLSVDTIANGFALKASGATVAFLEFGAGVHYPNDHPMAGKLGVAHGTYGKGLGQNDYWFYTGQPGNAGGELAYGHTNSTITHGNPANMPMYHAEEDIRREVLRIAKDVFK